MRVVEVVLVGVEDPAARADPGPAPDPHLALRAQLAAVQEAVAADVDAGALGSVSALGAVIATHNPAAINVNTAPADLVEAALRVVGRQGWSSLARDVAWNLREERTDRVREVARVVLRDVLGRALGEPAD